MEKNAVLTSFLHEKSLSHLHRLLKHIIDEYYVCKYMMVYNPRATQDQLHQLMDTIYFLQKISSQDLPLQTIHYTDWILHLDRILQSCRSILLDLQTSIIANHPHTTSLDDWTYPTLQDPHFSTIVKKMVYPLLYSSTKRFSFLILRGPRESGKTYFLSCLQEYCFDKKLPCRWITWNDDHFQSFPFSDSTIQEYRYLFHVWEFDHNSYSSLTPDRFREYWDKVQLLLSRGIFITTIITINTSMINDLPSHLRNCVSLLPMHETLDMVIPPPSSSSIFRFLMYLLWTKYKILNISSSDLHEISQSIRQFHSDWFYTDIERRFDIIRYIHLQYQQQSGIVWKKKKREGNDKTDVYYSHHSIPLHHQSNYIPYRITTPHYPAIQGAVSVLHHHTFFPHLLISNDMFHHMYFSDQEFVCEMKCNVSKEGILTWYEYEVMTYYMSFCLFHKYPRKGPFKVSTLQDMRYPSFFHQASEFFIPRQDEFSSSSSSSSSSPSIRHKAWFVVIDGSAFSSSIQLRLNHSIVVDIPVSYLNGPYINEITQLFPIACHAYQIQFLLPTQYSYYFFFQEPIVLQSRDAIQCCPLMSASTFFPKDNEDMISLPETYTLTNENDLDLLQQKFPTDYTECQRDNESTWKLKSLKHIDHYRVLNDLYSREQKFYLTMYHSYLQLSVHQFTKLNESQRRLLSMVLTALRNVIDFLFLLIPEYNSQRGWNQLWSISTNHPLFPKYTSSVSQRSERNYPVDITIAILQYYDHDFFIPEWWFEIIPCFFTLNHPYPSTLPNEINPRVVSHAQSFLQDFQFYKEWYAYTLSSPTETIPLTILFYASTNPHTSLLQNEQLHHDVYCKHLLQESNIQITTHITTSMEQFLKLFILRKQTSFYHRSTIHATHLTFFSSSSLSEDEHHPMIWFEIPSDPYVVSLLQLMQEIQQRYGNHYWNFVCGQLQYQETALFATAFSMYLVILQQSDFPSSNPTLDFFSYLFMLSSIYVIELDESNLFLSFIKTQHLFLRRLFYKYQHILQELKIWTSDWKTKFMSLYQTPTSSAENTTISCTYQKNTSSSPLNQVSSSPWSSPLFTDLTLPKSLCIDMLYHS